jgi:hypothetical protein
MPATKGAYVSTPRFIPRRERDDARRQSINTDTDIDAGVARDGSHDSVPAYLAIDAPERSDRPAARLSARLASDLVALSALVAMRAPLERP